MLTLGSWALGNVVTNVALLPSAAGSKKYFYEMNVYWNLVNLAIAGGGYLGNQKQKNKNFELYSLLSRQQKLEKVLLFNAGLDIAYIATGQLLKERSRDRSLSSERLEGFGNGLILQGVFLFTFDLILYSIHTRHKKRSHTKLSNIKLALNSGGIRMYF